MKKILAILFFLALAAPFGGTYIWLRIEKRTVKKAIKRQIIESIDKSELVLLKFSAKETQTELRWEHIKEFEYRGEMYDIVSTETHGDTTWYYCWHDREETKLNRKLAGLVEKAFGNSPEQTDRQEQLIDFVKKLFCTSGNFTISVPATEQNTFKQKQIGIHSNHTNAPPSPPPRPVRHIA